MSKRIAVRYMVMQGIENGISGFYRHQDDPRCAEPNKPYENGVCHTVGDELDMLALMAGFKTRDEFAREHGGKYWLNDYGKALSRHVKEVLETKGLGWMVDGELVHFYSPPGEFVLWPKSQNL